MDQVIPRTSSTILGLRSSSASRIRASPCGDRRPCSQFRRVPTATPMRRANAACERPHLLRVAVTSIMVGSLKSPPRLRSSSAPTLLTRLSRPGGERPRAVLRRRRCGRYRSVHLSFRYSVASDIVRLLTPKPLRDLDLPRYGSGIVERRMPDLTRRPSSGWEVQSSVWRNRRTATVIAAKVKAASARTSVWRSAKPAPFSMMPRTMRR